MIGALFEEDYFVKIGIVFINCAPICAPAKRIMLLSCS